MSTQFKLVGLMKGIAIPAYPEGDWFQDLTQIPKSEDVQIHRKWHSIYI